MGGLLIKVGCKLCKVSTSSSLMKVGEIIVIACIGSYFFYWRVLFYVVISEGLSCWHKLIQKSSLFSIFLLPYNSLRSSSSTLIPLFGAIYSGDVCFFCFGTVVLTKLDWFRASVNIKSMKKSLGYVWALVPSSSDWVNLMTLSDTKDVCTSALNIEMRPPCAAVLKCRALIKKSFSTLTPTSNTMHWSFWW